MSKKNHLAAADPKIFVEPFRVDGTKPFPSHLVQDRGTRRHRQGQGQEIIKANRDRLSDLQEKLYAQDRWSLLLIFQAMDAAGKDSAIESVFDGVNPQGCDVHSFKQPLNGGTRSRLHVARGATASRTRTHRHLQPLLL